MYFNGGEKVQQIVEQIVKIDGDINLVMFVLSLFDVIGLYQEDCGENVLVVIFVEYMMVLSYLGFFYEGVIIIFDCDIVLLCEDMYFISWEYFMV